MRQIISRNKRAVALTALLTVVVFGSAFTEPGCKKEADVVKVENKLNQIANGLNGLAKTNRELYQANTFNLATRKRVAQVILKVTKAHDGVVDRVYEIQPNDAGSIELGRTEVVQLIRAFITDLRNADLGNEKLRLAAEAIITLANEAIDLVQRVKVVTNGND